MQHTDRAIIMASPSFIADTGFAMSELIGRNCRFFQGSKTSSEQLYHMSKSLAFGTALHCVCANYRKDGTEFVADLLFIPMRSRDDQSGYPRYYLAIRDSPGSLRNERLKQDPPPPFNDKNIWHSYNMQQGSQHATTMQQAMEMQREIPLELREQYQHQLSSSLLNKQQRIFP